MIPMHSFPDRKQNDINHQDIATSPQENDDNLLENEGASDKGGGSPLKNNVIVDDDTDGGTGSKMLMTEGRYLGTVFFFKDSSGKSSFTDG